MRDHPIVQLAGLRISSVSMHELADRVFSELCQKRGGWVVTANLDFLQRAAESAEIRTLYERADLIIADGAPVIWAARLRGHPLPGRVAGSDLVWSLAARAAREGRSLYLLGGDGDAAMTAANRLRSCFPELRIAGCSSPQLSLPPSSEEIDAIRKELMRARPDLLYAGFGSPKQEYLIDALRSSLPSTWMMGCGISLSFIAGDIQRAPRWMRSVGLEWLHRMLQEPCRLAPRYLLRNLPFALRLLAECGRRSKPAPTG